MSTPRIEEVFKTSGVPTFTFVRPIEYERLFVFLRTPGRGLVIEGPSGIGKTTSVITALDELGTLEGTRRLNARRATDRELIAELPSTPSIGVVVIDDFHKLGDPLKSAIADFLKTLADEEPLDSKLVLIGINNAGDSLIHFAADLNSRLDTLRFGTNPEERILDVITKGEDALNVTIENKAEIAIDAGGSFQIVQILCKETCMIARILERCEERTSVRVSLETVRDAVLLNLAREFLTHARTFATGPRLRSTGRQPYLHMLHWLAQTRDWCLRLDDAIAQQQNHRTSVRRIIDKGYLEGFLRKNPSLETVLHYDPVTRTLAIEDPKFQYFLRHLTWSKFARDVGFPNTDFKATYDFALSFAGPDRPTAEKLAEQLNDHEVQVFYDKDEQYQILAESVEDYLAPIYRSEAEFVIVLLGKEYPRRIWTKFESDQFKQRFGEHKVIPIWFSDVSPGFFDAPSLVGGYVIDKTGDEDLQIAEIVSLVLKKLADSRAGNTEQDG